MRLPASRAEEKAIFSAEPPPREKHFKEAAVAVMSRGGVGGWGVRAAACQVREGECLSRVSQDDSCWLSQDISGHEFGAETEAGGLGGAL